MTQKPTETTAPRRMSSQEHRDKALELMAEAHKPGTMDLRRIGLRDRAQMHATLAVYEGLYELLGDNSAIDNAARESVMRGV